MLACLDLGAANFRFFAIVVLLVLQVSQKTNTWQTCETSPDNLRHRQAAAAADDDAAAAAADHIAESGHRADVLRPCRIVRKEFNAESRKGSFRTRYAAYFQGAESEVEIACYKWTTRNKRRTASAHFRHPQGNGSREGGKRALRACLQLRAQSVVRLHFLKGNGKGEKNARRRYVQKSPSPASC
jgi:hypothetical protein